MTDQPPAAEKPKSKLVIYLPLILFGCLQIIRMQSEIINRRADRLALRQANMEG